MSEGTVKYVYVLPSRARRRLTYVGLTEDFERRLRDHNAGQSPHASTGGPWSPAIVIRFEDDRKAERFERYLKSGSRRAFVKRHFL